MRTCNRCKHQNRSIPLKERRGPRMVTVRDELGDVVMVEATICGHCGCNMNRKCRKRPGRRKIGGKRGHNSGKVKSHSKKK